MYAPHYRLKSFEYIPEHAKLGVLDFLLEALTAANVAYLLLRPETPTLYESGVRYEEEPPGRDEWQDIPDTIVRRRGDCEDLACWRMADLRLGRAEAHEPNARFFISADDLPDGTGGTVHTFHIMIHRENGQIEDPSRRLGMP